ncbi:MAG: methylated-DNA--[protein]-cysteine S-methyltransferase [bacterium]
MKEAFLKSSQDYQRIEQAIRFLENNLHRQPSLQEVAQSVYVSEHHFQRLFSRWVGISPKRFLQYLTKEYAKRLLRNSGSLLDVTYETGLSSPGRLHDLFVTCEGMTPGEFKNQGEGCHIDWGVHPTPFGVCLLAVTERGVCGLNFVTASETEELSAIKKRWHKAVFYESPQKTAPLVSHIFQPSNGAQKPLHVHLKGTNFQIKVWEALLKIPYGKVVAYEDIADFIGKPKAVRAVANAVAKNPVPFLIPCHRVIRKLGDFGGYQGGTARKKAILGWEAAQLGLEERHQNL